MTDKTLDRRRDHAADELERRGRDISRRQALTRGAALAAGAALASAPGARAQSSSDRSGRDERGLAGRVAVVTGAARGIGRATALALADAGADIVALDIARPHAIDVPYALASRQDLDETAREVGRRGRRVLAVQADVRRLPELERAVQRAIRELGRVDIMVANAGVVSYAPIVEMTPRQWQDVIDVDLTGAFNSIKAVAAHMSEREQGVIVGVVSSEGRHGAPQVSHYGAAKWGLIGLIKGAATELGPRGVRVLGVAPTGVRTPLVLNEATYRWAGGDGPEDLETALRAYNTQPVGLIEPEDVADSIAFLVSPDARVISGTVLDVTAGASTRWSV